MACRIAQSSVSGYLALKWSVDRIRKEDIPACEWRSWAVAAVLTHGCATLAPWKHITLWPVIHYPRPEIPSSRVLDLDPDAYHVRANPVQVCKVR